jgi:cytochrome c biogenesis protein
MLKILNVELSEKQSGKKLGRFTIDFSDMQTEYKVGDYKVRALDYFPDFVFDKDQPSTRSTDPNNPVLLTQVEGPGIDNPVKQWFFPLGQMDLQQDSKYQLAPVGGKMVETTGLRVQKDNGIPIVFAGCAVVLAGLVLVFYFQHRRIWGRIDEGVLHIGAHTNKNWYGMRKQLESVLRNMGLEADVTIRKGGKT